MLGFHAVSEAPISALVDAPVVEPPVVDVVVGGGESTPKSRRLARRARRIERITGRKGSAIKAARTADEPKPSDSPASAWGTKGQSLDVSLTAPLFTPDQIEALKRANAEQAVAHAAEVKRREDAALTRAERQRFRAEAQRLRAEEDELMIVLALLD